MRLFCRRMNTGLFEGEHREVEGRCQRQWQCCLSTAPSVQGPWDCAGETPVFSRKPGTWGAVIKGKDSSWLQPDFKIDPIRPVTRNPGEPSAGACHHSTLPRTWACVQTGNNNSHFFISRDNETGAALSQWSEHFPKASLQVCLIEPPPYWERVQ